MKKLVLLTAALLIAMFPQVAMAQDLPPDCEDFATQAAAQTALRLDPSDPGGIDGAPGPNSVAGPITTDDAPPHPGDGIACEDNPGTRDEEPVPVTSGTTTTTKPSTTTTTEQSTSTTEALPFTGSHDAPMGVSALALIGLGCVLLLRNRKVRA